MKIYLVFFLGTLYLPLWGQSDTLKLTYKKYMEVALESNNSIKASQYELPIAETKINQAKLMADPTLSFGNVSLDMSGESLPSQWYCGISQKVELGNKRRSRMDLAMAEREVSKARYANFLRLFKLQAAERFIDALIAQMIYQKELNIYMTTKDQLEMKKNRSTNRLENLKINIELGEMLNQVYEAEMQLKVALLSLTIPEGQYLNENILKLEGDLNKAYKQFSIDSLIAIAKNNRPDLQESRMVQKKCEREKKIVQANRKIDLEIGIGDNLYTRATNELAPSPAYHAILATVSFPLKFSNMSKEYIKMADLSISQAGRNSLANELSMEVEIKQAFVRYEMAYKEMNHFKDDMLRQADWALKEELFNYQDGSSNFIELSESYRKLDEVYLAYYKTLKDYAYSLVELEYASGIWDVNFEQ